MTDLQSIAGSLASIAHNLQVSPFLGYPEDARSSYVEEVFSVYNIGRGVFDATTSHINLNVEMFDLSGRWVGVQTGVHVNITPPPELPPKLLAVPPAPPLPIDTPPVPRADIAEWTKGLFTFADGSSITAQGPAWTHLVPLNDGAFLFMVTTAQIITAGTGLFEGVRGVKQGTGTTYVAPGLVQAGKFPAPGGTFEAKVIDTFRLIRGGLLDVPAVSGQGGQGRETPEQAPQPPRPEQETAPESPAQQEIPRQPPARKQAPRPSPAGEEEAGRPKPKGGGR